MGASQADPVLAQQVADLQAKAARLQGALAQNTSPAAKNIPMGQAPAATPMLPGRTTLVSKGWEDAFVAKLSGADGAAIWARRAGGTQLDVANAVTFDASGDVVATGSVYPHLVDFDGVPFAGHGTEKRRSEK